MLLIKIQFGISASLKYNSRRFFGAKESHRAKREYKRGSWKLMVTNISFFFIRSKYTQSKNAIHQIHSYCSCPCFQCRLQKKNGLQCSNMQQMCQACSTQTPIKIQSTLRKNFKNELMLQKSQYPRYRILNNLIYDVQNSFNLSSSCD